MRLFTDGYFVDERNADRLAALYLGEVHVSLYSTQPDVFDKITQVPGSHDRVMRAIRLMRERDIKGVTRSMVWDFFGVVEVEGYWKHPHEVYVPF